MHRCSLLNAHFITYCSFRFRSNVATDAINVKHSEARAASRVHRAFDPKVDEERKSSDDETSDDHHAERDAIIVKLEGQARAKGKSHQGAGRSRGGVGWGQDGHMGGRSSDEWLVADRRKNESPRSVSPVESPLTFVPNKSGADNSLTPEQSRRFAATQAEMEMRDAAIGATLSRQPFVTAAPVHCIAPIIVAVPIAVSAPVRASIIESSVVASVKDKVEALTTNAPAEVIVHERSCSDPALMRENDDRLMEVVAVAAASTPTTLVAASTLISHRSIFNQSMTNDDDEPMNSSSTVEETDVSISIDSSTPQSVSQPSSSHAKIVASVPSISLMVMMPDHIVLVYVIRVIATIRALFDHHHDVRQHCIIAAQVLHCLHHLKTQRTSIDDIRSYLQSVSALQHHSGDELVAFDVDHPEFCSRVAQDPELWFNKYTTALLDPAEPASEALIIRIVESLFLNPAVIEYLRKRKIFDNNIFMFNMSMRYIFFTYFGALLRSALKTESSRDHVVNLCTQVLGRSHFGLLTVQLTLDQKRCDDFYRKQ